MKSTKNTTGCIRITRGGVIAAAVTASVITLGLIALSIKIQRR